MALRIRYSVFGRLVDIEGQRGNWLALLVGADGKRGPAGFIVPEFLEEHELGTYLADLFHEAATPRNGDVVRISVIGLPSADGSIGPAQE